MSENEPILPFEKPIAVDIEKEMRRSYIDYAMSVIIGRALPDVRDGLKPVHRRVLYGMWETGNTSNRAYKKSARIVGDVMGKYHPHGDSAIYDTVVRMAQDFTMRYPLVDGQGNFGSLDGDNPAAMRYTEVRLTKLAEELIREDIDKDTVDWAPNYDGSLSEPLVLPARLPNLLVNGSAGIAVGMATNIPPHNLSEVIDAVVMLIDRPDATLDDIMAVLPGPDFPTAGFIHGRAGIRSAYETGRGTIQVRARATIEDQKGSDKQSIVVTEIPYQVNKARLLERMGELIREKRIEGITDLRDESDREGLRIVLDVRRGEVAEVLLNQLYHQTQMQQTFGIILLAIVDNRPRVMDLLEILRHFIDHRKTVIVRRTRFDLRKAEERAHILEGLLKALDHLDEVIATIRASQTPDEARANLVARFDLSEVQARAILDMRLQRLTGLEREKIVDEYRETMALIERLRAILASDALVLAEIRRELIEIKETYGDARRTEIIAATHEISIEDMIADEPMVITVSRSGYVKRSPLSLYRAQRRGGKGRTGMVTRDEDIVEHLYVASAHDYILVFTQSGRVYWLKVHAIPEAGPAAKGKAIVNLLDLDENERFATTVSVRTFPADRYLVFATERGTVKKTSLSAFARPLARGIIAVNISDGDRLLAVKVAEPGQDILLATALGFSVRFPEGGQALPGADDESIPTVEGAEPAEGAEGVEAVEPSDEIELEETAEPDVEAQEEGGAESSLVGIRPMGRTATGVRGIRLRKGDRVVGMEILSPEGDILTVTSNGYGKRTALDEYRRQSRGGKGIINLKVSDRTGEVVGVKQVQLGTGAILITQDGMIIRIGIEDLRVIGRATQGVKVMDLAEDDRIVAVAKVDEDMAASDELAEDGLEETADETPTPDEPVN